MTLCQLICLGCILQTRRLLETEVKATVRICRTQIKPILCWLLTTSEQPARCSIRLVLSSTGHSQHNMYAEVAWNNLWEKCSASSCMAPTCSYVSSESAIKRQLQSLGLAVWCCCCGPPTIHPPGRIFEVLYCLQRFINRIGVENFECWNDPHLNIWQWILWQERYHGLARKHHVGALVLLDWRERAPRKCPTKKSRLWWGCVFVFHRCRFHWKPHQDDGSNLHYTLRLETRHARFWPSVNWFTWTASCRPEMSNISDSAHSVLQLEPW